MYHTVHALCFYVHEFFVVREDILLQFLMEAVVLTVGGGLIGISARHVSCHHLPLLQLPVLVSVKAVLVASLFSACVEGFFGFYPARKASALKPIDALRYE